MTRPPAVPRRPAPVKPDFGLPPLQHQRYHWAARAIFHAARRGPNGQRLPVRLETLRDRQGIHGEASQDERASLAAWLNHEGLAAMTALLDRTLLDRDRIEQVSGDHFTLRARVRGGYAYLSAGPNPNPSS